MGWLSHEVLADDGDGMVFLGYVDAGLGSRADSLFAFLFLYLY